VLPVAHRAVPLGAGNFTYTVFTLDAGLLARNQYLEGPATSHIGTGFLLISLCLKANSKLPLHASHVALLT
jgi:hypothetical protein